MAFRINKSPTGFGFKLNRQCTPASTLYKSAYCCCYCFNCKVPSSFILLQLFEKCLIQQRSSNSCWIESLLLVSLINYSFRVVKEKKKKEKKPYVTELGLQVLLTG